jgi:hypothetical protein
MEPVTAIVTALSIGAGAAFKKVAEEVGKDLYGQLKEIIGRKYSGVDIAVIEKDPASKKRQDLLEDELKQAKVGHDTEVLAKARELLKAAEKMPDSAEAAGIDLKQFRAASFSIEDALSSGRLLSGHDVDVQGEFKVKNVRMGPGAGEGANSKKGL